MMRFKINEDLKLIREMLELIQEEISLFIDVDKKQRVTLIMCDGKERNLFISLAIQ